MIGDSEPIGILVILILAVLQTLMCRDYIILTYHNTFSAESVSLTTAIPGDALA